MRRVPPAILLALALMAVQSLTHFALLVKGEGRPQYPLGYLALVVGTSYMVLPLLVSGMLELRQRGAAVGFALAIAVGIVQTALIEADILTKPGVHESVNFAFLAAHLVAMGSLASAVWGRRPVLAIGAIAGAIMSAPPWGLAKIILTAVGSYRGFSLIQVGLELPELIVLLLMSLDLAREPEPRAAIASDGLRHAARALCLFSLAAALAGIRIVYQPFLVTAFGATALAYAAFGLLRAAHSPIDRWRVTGAAASLLWCLSLQMSALPQLYGREFMREQPPMMFVMLIAAAAFVTGATKGTVDKLQLQAKGIGAIMMFVTALAIALFLVPQSQSLRSMNALDVLTGFVVALGAWMLSWLCKLAAQRLESSDSDLPAARVL